MCPLEEKFLIWITFSQLEVSYSGQRSLQSLLCITQVSPPHPHPPALQDVKLRFLLWSLTLCVCMQESVAARRKSWEVCRTSVRLNMIMVREAAFHLFKKHFIKSRIKRTLPGLSKHWTKVTFCGLFLSPMTVIKASVLSAHDKGSHAEVKVKVRKVLQSGQVALSLGTISIYPLSWTSRGCTCPILNPGETCLKHGSWYLYTSFLALKEQ